MKTLCIVTDELHPFTSGDTGRIVHNILVMAGKAAYLHLLLPPGSALDPEAVRARYEGRVEVHLAPPRLLSRLRRDGDDERIGLDLAAALKALRREGLRFDHVEFPDRRGWAAASLDARKSLGHGQLVVRLHRTEGMRRALEKAPWTSEGERTAAQERHALKNAQLVLAPFAPMADEYARFYELSRAWRRRVKVELPPLLGPDRIPPAREQGNDIVFPRPLRPLEQPELFVEGVVRFMRALPAFPGRVLFAPPTWEGQHVTDWLGAVPEDLADRFRSVEPAEREMQMARGIVVITTAHSPLCLTAYEAAASGAPLVLNAACSAFGLRTPWDKDGAAIRFDGTPESLARTLDAAWRKPDWAPRACPPDRPYWL